MKIRNIICLLLWATFAHAQCVPSPLSDSVTSMAERLIRSGFNAGDGYEEVWIRDFNTFMDLACAVNDKAVIRRHLLTFFQFQQTDGGILDGYIPVVKSQGVGYNYYHSALAPEYLGHKNTVETDQESSLVQAVSKYVRSTGDRSLLVDTVAGGTVLQHLDEALGFLLHERMDSAHGLIWGATTADWGDVQPEHSWGVELDGHTHRAIDIYDNAMFLIAIRDYVEMLQLHGAGASGSGKISGQVARWKQTAAMLEKNIRRYLWDAKRQQFRPHIYLNGSPFPATFDEAGVYYHGGTTVAIEAGLLSRKEVQQAYAKMRADMQAAHAATIGLTLYPVYPAGSFVKPIIHILNINNFNLYVFKVLHYSFVL